MKTEKKIRGGADNDTVTITNNPNVNSSAEIGDETRQSYQTPVKFENKLMLTPSGLLQFTSMIAPNVLVGFFLLLTMFNQNMKGVAYLVGVTVLFSVSNIINNFMFNSSGRDDSVKKTCHSYGIFSSNGGLSYGTLIYSFTFFYLLIPMIINNIINIPLLFSLIIMTILDGMVNVYNKCTSGIYIIISLLLASLAGTAWAFTIYSTAPGLTYHTDYITSNKLACSMPTEQKYRCKVMKNGEVIG